MLQKILDEDCYMLDIETTGLSPVTNGMTSFALVKFNPLAGSLASSIEKVIHYRINSSINVDMHRVNNPETIIFRKETGIDKVEDDLDCIHSLSDIPSKIQTLLCDTNINHRHIFALHTEFDVAFLKGYFEHAYEDFPFKHRHVWELTSLITGMDEDLHKIRDDESIEEDMEKVENRFRFENFYKHNALYDCIRQIAFLRLALIQARKL